MPVLLRPQSEADPLAMDEEEYQQLTRRTEGGWSRCADEREWLAKLHYLRRGRAQGKISEEDFLKRETQLVTGWLRTMT